jgi:hypothetical protein
MNFFKLFQKYSSFATQLKKVFALLFGESDRHPRRAVLVARGASETPNRSKAPRGVNLRSGAYKAKLCKEGNAQVGVPLIKSEASLDKYKINIIINKL